MVHILKKIAWYAVVALCAGIIDCAQALPIYGVQSWRTSDGLPFDQIDDLLLRRNGFLWIATPNGAARYDGTRFEVFRSRTHEGLVNNRVSSLYEDAEGTLYLGHSDGAVSIRTADGFRPVNCPEGGLCSGITGFVEDAGKVWAVNEDGEYLCVDCKGDGVATPSAAAMMPQRGWTTRDDIVVFVQDGAVLKEWGKSPWIIKDQPIIFLELKNGDIAAGSKHGGVFILHPDGGYSQINEADRIASTRILSLCEDREGGLWAGTISGLSRIERIPVRSLMDSEQLSDVPFLTVSCITPAAGGGVYIGTNKGFLFEVRNGKFLQVGPEERTEEVVRSLCEKTDGDLWYGESGTFLKRTDGQGVAVIEDGPSGADNWVLIRDEDGRLWAGGYMGVWREGDPWQCMLSEPDGVRDVRCMVSEKGGTIWVGMKDYGLVGFEPDGTILRYTTQNGLPGSYVSALHFDKLTDTLWIGACGDGLAYLHAGCIHSVNLGADIIYSILKDDDDRFWFLTEKGVLVLTREELEHRMHFGGSLGEMAVLGAAEGIKPVVSVVHGLASACRTEDGRIWFASEKSVEVVDPVDVSISTNEVPLYIRSLLVNKQIYNVEGRSEISIAPGVHRFDIQFSALGFSAPELLRFKYRLVGEHDDWTEFAGMVRTVSYQNLPPGQYRFEMLAANGSGLWNSQPLQLVLTVKPFWWQRLWFKVALYMGILVLVALLSLAVADRINRNKLIRAEQVRAIEEERTRIAMDIHDQIGSEVTRVTLLCHRFIRAFKSEDWTNAPRHIHEMERVSGKLVHSLDEIVWVVRPTNDTLNNLIMYLSKYVSELLVGTHIECELDVPFEVPEVAVSGPVRHNLYLGVKEALNNVIKHSGATHLVFSMDYSERCCCVKLQDNGTGFDGSDDAPFHRGLKSMKRRMELVNGSFSISAVPEGGTLVEFRLTM